jgi:hypothetical protein
MSPGQRAFAVLEGCHTAVGMGEGGKMHRFECARHL